MSGKVVPALGFLGFAACVACGAAKSDDGTSAAVGGTRQAGAGSASVAGDSNAVAGGGASAMAAVGGADASPAAGSNGVAGAATAGGTSFAGSAGMASAPLFSDDFEAATIDSTKWTPRITGGTMFDLDTTQKHGGRQSLHLKHSGFSSMLAAEGAPVFPAPNNTFYGRLWLRVAPADGGGLPQGHVVWFETGDVTNDTHEVRVGMNLGKFQSNLYYQGEVDLRDPDAKVLTNTWQCVQFKYGNDVLEVMLDNVRSAISTTNWVAADSANGNTTAKSNWSPTYAAFRLGWELGSGEIWYDDVALDDAPVACN
jgi:hypothetical protein